MPIQDPVELQRRLQNVTERLLACFEELDFVHSIAVALGRPEGVKDIDNYLLEETLTIFRADGGFVGRTRSDGSTKVAAVSGFSSSLAKVLSKELVSELSEKGALPFLVDDLPGALARRPELLRGNTGMAKEIEKELPRAFIAVPLEANREILGWVALGKNAAGNVFTAGDSKLLSTLATQASLYIRNADLLEKFKAKARVLGKRVEQLESDPRGRLDISWIKGESRAMNQVANQVELAAATDATVLLLGESGTGKSLIARILHQMSDRNGGAFVEVNCGAVAPGVIESELFGHARGAFTGADRSRPGLFEEANHGTILLDEVAELPLEAQVKLLNVLERRRVRRVGENRDRTVDVRVAAATNADLSAAVREGRFREDLFYRLNVLSLTIPPLRQRQEDILHLARKFLEELARETNRRIQGFSPEAEKALLAYRWPGNVRELRNVVERSLLLKNEGGRVEKEDLTLAGAGSGRGEPTWSGEPLTEEVKEFEKRVILEALEKCDGVVAKAADALGISRTNLHNKLRKHDLARALSWNDESQ